MLGEAYKENPFAAAERSYPVEMNGCCLLYTSREAGFFGKWLTSNFCLKSATNSSNRCMDEGLIWCKNKELGVSNYE